MKVCWGYGDVLEDRVCAEGNEGMLEEIGDAEGYRVCWEIWLCAEEK